MSEEWAELRHRYADILKQVKQVWQTWQCQKPVKTVHRLEAVKQLLQNVLGVLDQCQADRLHDGPLLTQVERMVRVLRAPQLKNIIRYPKTWPSCSLEQAKLQNAQLIHRCTAARVMLMTQIKELNTLH